MKTCIYPFSADEVNKALQFEVVDLVTGKTFSASLDGDEQTTWIECYQMRHHTHCQVKIKTRRRNWGLARQVANVLINNGYTSIAIGLMYDGRGT